MKYTEEFKKKYFEEYIYKLENNITSISFSLVNQFENVQAKSYFRFGFLIRSNMIMENRRILKELIKKDGQKYQDTTSENIHINSFYINLLAILDNLAWVLQHEFKLFDNVDENHGDKNKIGIFVKDFLKQLKQKDDYLVNEIEAYKKWFEKIKDFRHVAAHRMPLYCPPAILNEEQMEKKQRLEQEVSEINIDQDNDNFRNKYFESLTMGTYYSIFMFNGEKPHQISETITDKYEEFLKLIELLVEWIKKNVEIKGQAIPITLNGDS